MAEEKEIKSGHILVAGGSGFLGTNLTHHLLSLGHKVTVIDNFYTSSSKNISTFLDSDSFRLIDADILNFEDYPEDLDFIFNLACPASPEKYQKDPLYTVDVCYRGTKNLLELASSLNIGIFHASTSEIYGDPFMHPQPESYWGNVNSVGPRACYDEGKRVSETLCYEYNKSRGLNVYVGRIFNTYGPYMDIADGRVVSNFIIQALKNENITIYGDGSQTRSFCYVDDLIAAFTEILKMNFRNERNFGPFNLGNPSEISIISIANEIIKITNSNSHLTFLDLPIDDPIKRKPDITRIQKYTGWYPKIDLEEGIKKTIKYFEDYA